MGCDESFITMKLIWHGYLVPSLDNCAYETPIKTGLSTWIQPELYPLAVERKLDSMSCSVEHSA